MRNILIILTLSIVMVSVGCQEARTYEPQDANSVKIDGSNVSAPAKIKFTQLTEFVESWRIHAYIDVLDEYGSRIKSGCIWRFEIFSFQARSGDPRGTRLHIWDDIDLTNPEANNDYWEDFMRSYKFDLGLESGVKADENYVLDVTCTTADGQRLTDTIELRL